MGRLLMHAAYQPHFGVLLDRRRIYTPAATEYIHQFVQILDEERRNGNMTGRCAIIVSAPLTIRMPE